MGEGESLPQPLQKEGSADSYGWYSKLMQLTSIAYIEGYVIIICKLDFFVV